MNLPLLLLLIVIFPCMSTKNETQDASPVQMYSRLLNLASISLAKVSNNVKIIRFCVFVCLNR